MEFCYNNTKTKHYQTSIYKYISNVLDQVGVDKSENVGYAIITIHFLLEHPT
jgi:hypothetical protein